MSRSTISSSHGSTRFIAKTGGDAALGPLRRELWAPMRDWTAVRRTRARLRAARGRVSGCIAGSRTVEGSIRRPWPREMCAPCRRPRQLQRFRRVSTDRTPPCAPCRSEPAWNAQHGFGPGECRPQMTAREFVRESLQHDWEFATHTRRDRLQMTSFVNLRITGAVAVGTTKKSAP
jgi:hypothetical protein